MTNLRDIETEPLSGRELLAASGISKNYGHTAALRDVSVRIRRGESLGVVGESGAGKSTLLRILLGLEQPDLGAVWFEGVSLGSGRAALREFRRNVQVVFQDPRSSLDPRMSVTNIVMEPLRALNIGDSARARRTRAAEVLNWVGLSRAESNRRPAELSGGQRQRVAIARALGPGPQLVIGDEPVSALDVSLRSQILDLLAELQSELNLTLLVVSHDISVVSHLCQEVVVLHGGTVVESGPVEKVLHTPLERYTQELLASVPVLR